jgi:hypothetical protein
MWAMRYTCPITNRQIQKTCGTDDEALARKMAEEWEKELNRDGYTPDPRMTWPAFRDDFRREFTPPHDSLEDYEEALDAFEQISSPQRLSDITDEQIAFFPQGLRTLVGAPPEKRDAMTERLATALHWASSEGLTSKRFKLPQWEH